MGAAPPTQPSSTRRAGERTPWVLPQTDWLRHDLIISGAAADVAALQDAACGAGAIPWGDPDPDLTEEDRVLALIRPPDGSPGLSVVAARVLARQLRDAEDRHRQRVQAAMGRSRACPFDLHALLPVPQTLLHHGPHDAVSLAWLRQHWGTAQPLRRVEFREDLADARLRRSARVAYAFWSADWTPWAAFAALRQLWPKLVFDVRPDYGDG